LIRWTSCQIRAFAYFNNLVLIVAFLGMGLGVAVGRRRGDLVHWTLPTLLILSIPLALSEKLGIVQLPFPDPSVSLWGADILHGGAGEYVRNIAIFVVLVALVVLVFVCAGSAVGWLFPRLEALRAYTADLLGSLLGVLAFTAITSLDSSPPVWLAVGSVPFLWLSRKPSSLASFVGIVVLGWLSIQGAAFSPYNRIDIAEDPLGIMLNVNRDYHQMMLDLSDEALDDRHLSTENRDRLRLFRDVYDLQFQMKGHRDSALILGAGTGNDARAALRSGYRRVLSVDIDPLIIELGEKLHPERPYDDPRVTTVVNDARAFFEQYSGPPFDVVCYGLLDSHAMFSSMSSLRLDNFVYTEEGIRAGWEHVSDRGYMSVSFSVFGGRWIADRLYWTVYRATGVEPLAIYHGMSWGATFLVAPRSDSLDASRIGQYPRVKPEQSIEVVRTPTDDWPFLYVRPDIFPWTYLIVLSGVLVLAVVATPFALGTSVAVRDFHPALFFMGAAFLLIETRGVTTLSLLFGSTWVVNSAIFSGILIMVLVANLVVLRFRPERTHIWFALLLASTAFLVWFDCAWLNQMSMVARGAVGGLVHALPIGFAGVIVSILLARSPSPPAALGSNLLGAVVGGCLEYFSMVTGLRNLVLLALVLYLVALLSHRRNRQPVA